MKNSLNYLSQSFSGSWIHSIVLLTSILLIVLLMPAPTYAALFGEQSGKHTGEQSSLSYTIEYLDPLGTTTVDATGITYDPFDFSESHEPTILPESYFGSYPLYFAGSEVQFRVYITNTGARTYKNLYVRTQQELLNPDGFAGIPFPEPNDSSWFIESLHSGETIVLDGNIFVSGTIPSGIDQTHLQIIHFDKAGENKANPRKGNGRIILDDPQAGLWCPLSP